MKIYNITIHRNCNYGSVLQTYATQKTFEDLQFECETIDFVRQLDTKSGALKRLKNKSKRLSKNPILLCVAKAVMLISYIKKQYHGVGRAMKLGKEAIMGLLAALEQYENKDKQAEVAKNVKIVDWLVDEINQIPNLKAQKIQDEAGRAIFRARVFVDPEKAGMTATELEGKLKAGTPTIRCRTEFMSLGSLDFDPRPLVEGDKELIVAKLKEIMEA